MLSRRSGEDVSTHLAKLRSIRGDLNNGLDVRKENKLPDLMLVCKTLNILPDKFETFRSSQEKYQQRQIFLRGFSGKK